MGFTPEALQDEDEAEVEEEKSNYNNSARDENSERKMIKSQRSEYASKNQRASSDHIAKIIKNRAGMNNGQSSNSLSKKE